ncbi:uncharacterized protein LOC126686698 isoform X2 [Mercurialis annua]|uniref:uncharacterized protein LOC126686698 isoform X2 n=1 Tax=Mercurialis annua TaxID=3986 RepID=UPI00215E101E|nr:uncharacterized protein LOC126686698 isoform X2 [Mercurialis annua]
MNTLFQIKPPSVISSTIQIPEIKFQTGSNQFKPKSISNSFKFVIYKSLPFAASVSLLLSATPASAGIMSGFSGLESVPGPELPKIDFLAKINEENQKKYAENDARFKSSPILKELLERSKNNKEKHKNR